MTSVTVSDTIERNELFGSMDRNLRMIEKKFDCLIIQRDNELLIRGEQSEEAAGVLREMMRALERNEPLDQQKIDYIMDLNGRGIS